MPDPTPEEVLHERLKAFLLFLKPRLLVADIDQDKLAQLRRLSDVRIRKFAVDKPQITGLDLCALLADPRVGRFDDVADQSGALKKGHLAVVLPTLAEDMGYLIEACLTLQVLGLAAMQAHAKAFVEKHGALAAPAGSAAPAAKAAAAPLPPAVAKALAPIRELWSLAPSTLKALQLLAAADSRADQVCAEIEKDPDLAVQFLKFVNASPSGPCSSVKKAVVSLGYPLTRRFVMTAALALKLGPPYAAASFDPKGFWRQSLQLAHMAAQISKTTGLGHPDEHFSAGLLHGIGRIALAKAGTDGPDDVVGAEILARWRFPAAVVEAARHHRDTQDQIEEIQLPREAIVAWGLHHFLTKGQDVQPWAGFLRVDPDFLPRCFNEASRPAWVYE